MLLQGITTPACPSSCSATSLLEPMARPNKITFCTSVCDAMAKLMSVWLHPIQLFDTNSGAIKSFEGDITGTIITIMCR